VKLLALVLAVLAVSGPAASLPDIEDEVMCVECKTALNVSTSPVADQERAFIRRQIALGKDKAEVKAALVDEFGPGVLADPPREGFDLAAYLVPGLLVLFGLLGIALAARRWRRRAPAAAPAGAPLAEEDERRLDAELSAFDRR
jgi:cytochrome c-type biogenesis protein CcmH